MSGSRGAVPVRKTMRPLTPEESMGLLAGLVVTVEAAEGLLWQAVATMLAAGAPVDELAAVLRVSRDTVYRGVKRHQND